MDSILPAYKAIGERRYRETSGLYWEDFKPGDTFEHRPGRAVLDTDNVYFTLLTMNTQQVHFDAAYAAQTEWKKPLVPRSGPPWSAIPAKPARQAHSCARITKMPRRSSRALPRN